MPLIPIYTWNKTLINFGTRRKNFTHQPWAQGVILLACVVVAMLLANLPYARESAAGAAAVSFFDVNDAEDLAHQMELVIRRKISNFGRILPRTPESPYAPDWQTMFALLLEDESTATR